MSICVIADQIYKSGGIERVLSLRINQWIKKGYDVHLITNENEQRLSYFYYDEKLVHHDLDGNFNKNISLFSSSNLVLAAKYFFKLKKSIDQIKPDVIVVVNYSYEFYFLPFLRKESYCIKEYHSSYSAGQGWVNRLKNYCATFYHTHVFLSLEEALLSQQPHYAVIPNPTMQIDAPVRNLAEREKKIICVGKISYQKGQDILVDIWKEIHKTYPDWELHLYGKEDLTVVDTLNLSDNIFFHPPSKEILEKYLESSIYVMPSRFEGFGMVLIEAMECGLPCISFNCNYGPSDIIVNNEEGFLVENDNTAQFQKRLELLMGNHDLRLNMGARAKQNVQRYSAANIIATWDRLFRDLVA